jgi:hypothetical protein
MCAPHIDAFNWPTSISGLASTMAITASKEKSCRYVETLSSAKKLRESLKTELGDVWDGWNTLSGFGENVRISSKSGDVMKSAFVQHYMFSNGKDDSYLEEVREASAKIALPIDRRRCTYEVLLWRRERKQIALPVDRQRCTYEVLLWRREASANK